MINKNIKTNNMTIVRNIAYKQIEKMNKNIKEVIEVDNTLLTMIDINMKNAINKIINDYKTDASGKNFYTNNVTDSHTVHRMNKNGKIIWSESKEYNHKFK